MKTPRRSKKLSPAEQIAARGPVWQIDVHDGATYKHLGLSQPINAKDVAEAHEILTKSGCPFKQGFARRVVLVTDRGEFMWVEFELAHLYKIVGGVSEQELAELLTKPRIVGAA